jgi:uncharacterized protein (TIGR02246 family)
VVIHSEEVAMSKADDVLKAMSDSYASAVNAGDSAAYATLFAPDAIRMPPGANLEYGPDEIRRAEQADYDAGRWNVSFTPRDALEINDRWVYGIADGEVTIVPHAGGEMTNVRLTVTWLYERQPSGMWSIKRQMWNLKPN